MIGTVVMCEYGSLLRFYVVCDAQLRLATIVTTSDQPKQFNGSTYAFMPAKRDDFSGLSMQASHAALAKDRRFGVLKALVGVLSSLSTENLEL